MRERLEDRITVGPEICNGKSTIRGKRITVQTILEFLLAGEDREEILRQYPSLEPADIDACLTFAIKRQDSKGLMAVGSNRTRSGYTGLKPSALITLPE